MKKFHFFSFLTRKIDTKKRIYKQGLLLKGRIIMKELTLQEQYEIQGGSLVGTALLYLLLGAGIYKIWKSKKGRISIPRLINIEWRN